MCMDLRSYSFLCHEFFFQPLLNKRTQLFCTTSCYKSFAHNFCSIHSANFQMDSCFWILFSHKTAGTWHVVVLFSCSSHLVKTQMIIKWTHDFPDPYFRRRLTFYTRLYKNGDATPTLFRIVSNRRWISERPLYLADNYVYI